MEERQWPLAWAMSSILTDSMFLSENISKPFRSEGAAKAINGLDRWLVYGIALVYLGLLAYLAFTLDMRAIRFALVPAIAFAVTTLIRSAINAPRPYEQFDIDPIIHKSTQGKSLPSRHVASATIIACALYWMNVPLGFVAFAACIIVSTTRIIGGVHFPRDVFAAIALALVIGVVGFALIP